jgi:hypothetical protein
MVSLLVMANVNVLNECTVAAVGIARPQKNLNHRLYGIFFTEFKS